MGFIKPREILGISIVVSAATCILTDAIVRNNKKFRELREPVKTKGSSKKSKK